MLISTFITAPVIHRVTHSRKRVSPPRASLDPDTDWRAFRARLFRSETSQEPTNETRWAHPVPFIEKGTLLIASPEHFTANHSCAFFANTLVYILEHNSFSTAGLILNRPIATLPPPDPQTLYLGGPVGLDTLAVLHRDPSFGRAIVGDVRAAGYKDVMRRVDTGVLKVENCRFFCGYSGWAAGQLEEEVSHGVWYTCAASDSVVMDMLEEDSLVEVLRLLGGRFEDIARRLDDGRKTSK